MENEKKIRYTMQLAILKKLMDRSLIYEDQYEQLRKALMQDYHIVSYVEV